MRRLRRSWTLSGALRHHLAVVALAVAIGGGCAGAAILARPPTYQATAVLYLDPRYNSQQGFDLALQASELLSAHIVQVATTAPVLADACAAYRSGGGSDCSPATLAAQVSAGTLKSTSMIGVSARSRDPRTAAALANAVAGALVNRNRAEADAAVKPTADYLDSQLKGLDDQIAAAQATLAQLSADPSPAGRAQAANVQGQLTLLQTQYSTTYQKKQDLVLARSQVDDALAVYQPADAPTRPSDPDPLLYLGIGAGAGLAVGVAIALLLERLDDRLRGVDELLEATGGQVGLAVPASALRPGSPQQVRFYRLARAHVLAGRADARQLLVAAAGRNDRAYPVAAGLGAVTARAGKQVLVVDAEAGAPPHRLFALPAQGGGIHSLPGKGARTARDGRGGRSPSRRPRLSFLGVDLDDPDEVLEAIEDTRYHAIVIAAPPPYSDPTGVALAPGARAAVLVATRGGTTFAEAQRASEALERAGIEVVAAILVSGGERRSRGPADLESETLAAAPDSVSSTLPAWRGPSSA